MKKQLSLLFLIIVVSLSACSQNSETQWQEQYDLGVRYLSEGNYEEAIIAFTAAIEIDPNRAEAYVGRGDAYVGSGETEDNLSAAQLDYENAIRLDEVNTGAWLGLVDVCIRREDYDTARTIIIEAMEKIGDDQEIIDKFEEIDNERYIDSAGMLRSESIQTSDEFFADEECFVRSKGSYYNADGTLSYTEEYIYSEKGYLEQYISRDNDGIILESYKFDEFGNIVVRNTGDGDSENEIIYGENGAIALSRNPGGWWTDYTYNEDLLIQKTTYMGDGDIMGIDYFSYDSSGRLIGSKNYNYVVGDESIDYLNWEHSVNYNDQNQVAEVDVAFKGNKSSSVNFSYDNDGNLISIERIRPDGSMISTLLFEYKANGNKNNGEIGEATPVNLLIKFAGIITTFH